MPFDPSTARLLEPEEEIKPVIKPKFQFDPITAKLLPVLPESKGIMPVLSEATARPRTIREYITPAWMTKYKEKPGERTLLGDIFERPGAAIRSALMGRGYVKGALEPEKVPTFQEQALTEYYRPTEKITTGKVIGGLGVSALGQLADMATNPAELLSWLSSAKVAPKIPPIAPKQAIKPIITPIKETGKFIARKRPRIMGDKWFIQQGRQGKIVAEGFENALGNAYSDFYKSFGKVATNANKIDDILLRSNLDDATLKAIDTLVPGRIDTVEKAKMAHDILRQRTPSSYYLEGGRIGKGGLASVKLRQMSTARALKDEIRNSISAVNKEAGNQLLQLDTFAHNKIYPTIQKMYQIFGRGEIPSTEQIVPVYKGILSKAAQRQTLRETPKVSKQMRQYITADYGKDLNELIRNSKQLVRDMRKFRIRQFVKKAALIGGIGYGGLRGYGLISEPRY